MHDLTRVRRSRAKGAELPPGTLCVARPGRWGNPWRVANGQGVFTKKPKWYVEHDGKYQACQSRDEAIEYAVQRHRLWLWCPEQAPLRAEFCAVIREQGIRQLACWCPLDRPCHADTWIEVWQKEGCGDGCR